MKNRKLPPSNDDNLAASRPALRAAIQELISAEIFFTRAGIRSLAGGVEKLVDQARKLCAAASEISL